MHPIAKKLAFRACLLMGLLAGACSPLDIKPYFDQPTEDALSTTDNLESAVNGCYQGMQGSALYGANLRLLPDLIGDQVNVNSAANERGLVSFLSVYQRILFATGDNTWLEGYRVINRANNIIDAIDRGLVERKDEFYNNNKDRIKGEALFCRAAMHFELCRLFGVPYGLSLRDNGRRFDEAQSGVILRLVPSDSREPKARASTKEVYDQVIADLQGAIALLPETNNPTIHPRSYGGRVGGRATKDAAKALLAIVYYNMNDPARYADILSLIDDVLGGGPGASAKYPLDVLTELGAQGRSNFLFAKRGGNEIGTEVIFQIVNAADASRLFVNSTSATLINAYFPGTGDETAQPPHYRLIADQSAIPFNVLRCMGPIRAGTNSNYSDNRLGFFTETSVSGTSSSRFVAKYIWRPIEGLGNTAVANIPIFRASKLMLIRAEINILQGNYETARQDIQRTFARFNPNAGAFNDLMGNTAEALLALRRERVRELCFEGERLHNARHDYWVDSQGGGIPNGTTGHESGILGTESQGSGTTVGRFPASMDAISSRALFPIPDAELFSNPLARPN